MAKCWLLLLLQWSVSITAAEPYATCLSCPDVASPGDCRQSITCGQGEICYTRAFTDSRGLHGFRLGCEDMNICNGTTNANVIIGKRDVANGGCFDCCSGFECNRRLCQAVSPTTPPDCPPCTCSNTSGCPKHYIQHGRSCYLFSTWSAYWSEAREYCQKQKGDLVSINNKDEQDFLVQELSTLDITTILMMHIGGIYSPSLHKWTWVDGSPVQYTNWMFQDDAQVQTNETIVIFNPAFDSLYKTGSWSTETAIPIAFICEKAMI